MAKKKKAHKKVHRTKSSGARKPERLPVAAAAAAAATVAPATAPTVPAVPAGPAAASVAAASPVRAPARPASQPLSASRVSSTAQPTGVARWSYVRSDLRRVGLLILACVIIEAILWVLFNHTGLGPSLYNRITL